MLEHIHKQQEQINNNIVKSYGVTASSNELQKGGKRATIGEVRTWGSEKWVKHADGWVHVHPTTSKATIEKPGGKREQASEEHVNHYKSHIGRNEKETGEKKEETTVNQDEQEGDEW